ncbi:MAG: methionyl-tRNA formyltransferase [Balneolales bacterium]
MKIVFMGSPEFAVPSLIKLHKSSHEITAVVSGMDKRRGRGKATSPTPVKEKAVDLGIPVMEVENLRDPDFADKLQALRPELVVVVAFRVLPPSVLAIPEIGSVNLHASLLPKYRGAAPIHRAVMEGETVTGCTVFFLDEKVDTGKIINKTELPFGPNDTTGMVYDKLMRAGADLLLAAVNEIAKGDYILEDQNEALASGAPRIHAGDCLIDFNQPAGRVHNFIRGLSPLPAARIRLDGRLLKIYLARSVPDADLDPFELKVDNDRVLAGCNPGAVLLKMVQLEGKPRSNAADFFRGYNGPGILTRQ